MAMSRGRFSLSLRGDRERATSSSSSSISSDRRCSRQAASGRVGSLRPAGLSLWRQHQHQHWSRQSGGGGGRPEAEACLCSAMIVPGGPWTEWAAICFAGVSGLYLERNGGELVKTLSAPLLATLIALIMTNIGIIPSSSEVYTLINRFMLPLAVPMLLLSANLRKVFAETKRLLGAFLLGSLATCIATCVTFYFIPLANLGAQESWKVRNKQPRHRMTSKWIIS